MVKGGGEVFVKLTHCQGTQRKFFWEFLTFKRLRGPSCCLSPYLPPTISLSPCLPVSLSPCHPVTMSPYHPVTISPCLPDSQSPVSLLFCLSSSLSPVFLSRVSLSPVYTPLSPHGSPSSSDLGVATFAMSSLAKGAGIM